MMELTCNNEILKTPVSYDTPMEHLRFVLLDYLKQNPKLSLNGLSKRCTVSEPTLRRIRKGQIKTLPNLSTIMDLLSYISKKSEANDIVEYFAGPLGKYIREKAPQVDEMQELQFSQELSETLKDPAKYVLYKLAANPEGVTLDKAIELFGGYGERQLSSLEADGWLKKEGFIYRAKIESFSLSHDVFVDHFKIMADFIKPHKHANAHRNGSPIFSNRSSSINKKAYAEILKVQRAANKKIAQILYAKESKGSIPTFVIQAVDTIDPLCADEFKEPKKS